MPDNKTVTLADAIIKQLDDPMYKMWTIQDAVRDAVRRTAAPTPAAQSAGQEAIYQAMWHEGDPWVDVPADSFEKYADKAFKTRIVYAAPVNGGERELGQVIDERDQYHDAAEKLADAIAKHFGVEIGEHSNLNCPWQNALDHIAQATKRAADAQQVGVDARVAELEAMLTEVTDCLAWLNSDDDGHIMALTDRARAALTSPAKEVDWDAVRKAVGKCPAGSCDVASTGTFLTPISSPAKVGGDERGALTADEVSFVLDVYRYPRAKLSWETTAGVWSRPEALDLVTCVGSYKWDPTSKLDAIIRAALSADGGDAAKHIEFLTSETDRLREALAYWQNRASELADVGEDKRDAERLDFMIEQQAWVQWTVRDGSIRQCQVYTQDEDENYHILSGEDRFFSTPREAIDAASQAKGDA